MSPFFINNDNPNLNTYKDAANKFKAMNVVYTDSNEDIGNLYLDANCTIPLTLTKMVEMLQNGLPIAGCIDNKLCFAQGVETSETNDDYSVLDSVALIFSRTKLVTAEGEETLTVVPFVGMVNFTEEEAGGNLEYGHRDGDGYDQGYRGGNVNGFTIAFGLNTAAQKVIPNPFK